MFMGKKDALGPKKPKARLKTMRGGKLREKPQIKNVAREEPAAERMMAVER